MEPGCICKDLVWECCDDDAYCGQCGRIIAWLESPQQAEPVGTAARDLWIYADDSQPQGTPFVAALTVVRAVGSNPKQKRLSHPSFKELPRSSGRWQLRLGKSDGHFAKILFFGPAQQAYSYRPDEQGDEISITLEGNFGNRLLDIHLFQRPSIDAVLKARGISPIRSVETLSQGTTHYEVFGFRVKEMELELRVSHAPIKLREDIFELAASHPSVAVKLREPLRAGTVIRPGAPSKILLDTNLQGLDQPDDECIISLELPLVGDISWPIRFVLRRAAKGIVYFDPSPYVIDELYEGEIQSNCRQNSAQAGYFYPVPDLYVCNDGNFPVSLKSVTLDPPLTCLKVRWASKTEVRGDSVIPSDDGSLELPPEGYGQIRVDVDLSKIRHQHNGASQLRSRIVVRDADGVSRDVEFELTRIRKRELLDSFLAIDFGNSYSHAAICHLGAPFWLPQQQFPVISALGYERNDDIHGWPTALLFTDLSNPDNPSYLIGHKAIDEAKFQQRRLLVTDLKRWLASDHRSCRTVEDLVGNRHTFRVSTLVCLYIEKLIEQAQQTIRKGWIRRVGVSCPARFSHNQRRAFEYVLKELIDRNTTRRDGSPVPIEIAPIEIDEATALTIGVVFEPEFEQLIRQAVTSDNPTFVVASFDLGGGSLDTSLQRIRLVNYDPSLPLCFDFEHLGRGGDERFGGDNVTAAVYEILLERIRNWFEHNGASQALKWLKQIPPLHRIHEATPVALQNYHIFWLSAERIKIYLTDKDTADTVAQSPEVIKRELEMIWKNALRVPSQFSGTMELLEGFLNDSPLPNSIQEVCERKLAVDMWGRQGASAVQRIEQAIDELLSLAKKKDCQIDFVVLGGAGSRLPIVRELWKSRLSETHSLQLTERIWFTPNMLKSRVAFGLSRYLDVQHGGVSKHRFDASFNCVTAALAIFVPGANKYIEVVPNGARVDRPDIDYHLCTDNGRLIPLDRLMTTHLKLFRWTYDGYVCVGQFELPRELLTDKHVAAIRFNRTESAAQLCVYSYDPATANEPSVGDPVATLEIQWVESV